VKNIQVTALLIFFTAMSGCVKQNSGGMTIINGILSTGVEIGYPPMEYYNADGNLTGFDIELARALAEKLKMDINFIDTSWDGILAGLDTGRYDMAVNVTVLPERQRRFNFTKPYLDSSMTIVSLKNSTVSIRTPEDIKGLRVSYQNETTAQYFADRLRRQGINFYTFSYEKIINCFDDLKLGRLDLIIVDNIVSANYASAENSPFEIIWQGPSGEYIAICLKKGNDALTAMLDEALDELLKDGTLPNISYRFFGQDLVTPARLTN